MADDLVASSVRLAAAKKAAADLQQQCFVCTTTFLRDEGALLVNEALNVINLIEETIEDEVSSSRHLTQQNMTGMQDRPRRDSTLVHGRLWEQCAAQRAATLCKT